MASADSDTGLRRLAAVLFTAIVLMSIGALALTQELRSRPDVVNTVHVENTPDEDGATIRFELTQDEDDLTVAIIGAGGDVVATPIAGEQAVAGAVRTSWDGVVAFGSLADPGDYRVRFTLGDLDREAFLPGTITVVEPVAGEAPPEGKR